MMLENLFLAFAIGDAFGASVEFRDREWIRANVDFSALLERQAVSPTDGLTDYRAWDYTDDTEMTIALMKALLANVPFSEDLLVEKWREEYELGVQKKGYGRAGHGSMRWYYQGEKSIEEIRNFQRNRPNPGNAAAMRSVPLGLLPTRLINEYAAINARATHPHPHAILSSQCVAWAVEFMLRQTADPKDLLDYCRERIAFDQHYLDYFAAIEKLPAYEDLDDAGWETLCGPQPIQAPYFMPGIRGLASDSKYTAGCVLYILQNSHSAMDALQKSVYVGGDVDSLAAITTGIWAARTGLDDLPHFMKNKVEGKEYLRAMAKDFERVLCEK